MTVSFNTLKNNYPNQEEKTELFNNVIGGGFTQLVNNTNYDNTCAMRISVACNNSGLDIPLDWGQNGNRKYCYVM